MRFFLYFTRLFSKKELTMGSAACRNEGHCPPPNFRWGGANNGFAPPPHFRSL